MRAYDVIAKQQDLTHLDWSERSHTSGTSGSFLKASEGLGTGRLYYKLSCYDSYRGIYGHECVNELIAARLMDLLGVDHVAYKLIHAKVKVDNTFYDTWLSQSRSYRHSSEKKQAFDTFYRLNREGKESPLDFCDARGWGIFIRKMMTVDFLIANRDRHGANIEVLRGSDGECRLAPLFDNGLSFVFSCYGDEKRVEKFDVMEDIAANNYVGTRSLEENLSFLRGYDLALTPLEDSWREMLFLGLDKALPQTHQDVIWRMIKKRWEHLAIFLDT